MPTIPTLTRRLATLEQQHASRHRWSEPCAPPKPSPEKLRDVMKKLMEMGYYHPRIRSTTVAGEQQRRWVAQRLWPEQWDEWLAKAAEADAEEVEREAVS